MRLILWIIALYSPERWRVGALYVQGLKWSVGYNTSTAYGEHAEDLAIAHFKKKYGIDPDGGVMYCTFSPCSHCSKTLEQYDMNSRYVKRYTGKL